MFFSAIAASAFAAMASAQTIVTSSAASVAASTTVSQSMPPTATAGFNPTGYGVNDTVTFAWCQAQRNTCPQICGGAAAVNICDNKSLTYSCVCANGTVPDVSSYAQTLPYYICQQTFIQCMYSHPNDLQGQDQCQKNEKCGTRNATAEALAFTQASTMTTASSTAASSSRSGSASASSAAASATSSGLAGVYSVSTGAFAAILMAAARLAL